MRFHLKINATDRSVDVPEDKPLLWVLREDLGLPGTKFGCGWGLCGACTVQIDGVPTRSCQMNIGDVGDAAVTTIESVGSQDAGVRIGIAWLELDVPQCGYCQAGQIMTATALLRANPQPSDEDIMGAMSSHLCRCATYPRIQAAIKLAASRGIDD